MACSMMVCLEMQEFIPAGFTKVKMMEAAGNGNQKIADLFEFIY